LRSQRRRDTRHCESRLGHGLRVNEARDSIAFSGTSLGSFRLAGEVMGVGPRDLSKSCCPFNDSTVNRYVSQPLICIAPCGEG
jgi:hypothetical protein